MLFALFIYFFKRGIIQEISFVKYFPGVFDCSTVYWGIDLKCSILTRGYQNIHTMIGTEQDEETNWTQGQETELLWVLVAIVEPQLGLFI